ncbi:cysteine hydrolase family protein [Bacillus sp. DX1.1]|uniref:cysteine hydrolase family protein n=1 Tax=unclassified Bacillus (in: firmicutes) TaxID=185979 RepID=UPI002570B27B|nr:MULTISPECIES: cysteine hydrolase family protein [unclassified Bacillus (in: firmicutes)]MDM5155298.1 cysteine hydrolase family protein [Bacillus sp. DX1.1]WJE84098.1 cysteine hydrolase family protein [Bacillus sp. DX3.1]
MKKALIVIDVQEGMYTVGVPVHHGKELLEKLSDVIDQCRSHNIPVIYVQHNGPKGHPLEKGESGWHIHSKIAPVSNEVIVEKETPDSFYETNLREVLQKEEIEQLIICGLQTEYCVDTTVRRAFSEGYKTTLIRDAHSTFDSEQLGAEQIVLHHNKVLGSFADIVDLKDLRLN